MAGAPRRQDRRPRRAGGGGADHPARPGGAGRGGRSQSRARAHDAAGQRGRSAGGDAVGDQAKPGQHPDVGRRTARLRQCPQSAARKSGRATGDARRPDRHDPQRHRHHGIQRAAWPDCGAGDVLALPRPAHGAAGRDRRAVFAGGHLSGGQRHWLDAQPHGAARRGDCARHAGGRRRGGDRSHLLPHAARRAGARGGDQRRARSGRAGDQRRAHHHGRLFTADVAAGHSRQVHVCRALCGHRGARRQSV